MRVALYFTTAQDDLLTKTASEWLGRDAFTRQIVPQQHSFKDETAFPRRYGWHATMKAPFSLNEGISLTQLEEHLGRYCAQQSAVMIDRMDVKRIGRFFAYVPNNQPHALNVLAEDLVRTFEPYRAPLTKAQVEAKLTGDTKKDGYLREFGYPHIFDEFRFHMTLTGSVDDTQACEIEAPLRTHFSDFIGRPLQINQLALSIEEDVNSPFLIRSVHSFQDGL